jgi:hypothetical protein
MGRDKGVLIPVMIDSSTPPFGFGEVQAANLATWNGEPDHPGWRRFVDAVAGFSKAEPRPVAPQPAMSAPPRVTAAPVAAATPKEKKGVPVWVWVAGAVVATIVVLGIIGSMMPTTGPTPQVTANNGVQPAVGSTPVTPAPTTADNPQAIILQQLQQAEAAAAQQGFQLIGQPFSGSLAQGQSWNVPAQLFQGYDYRVLGVCDRDCADLDLVLFDSQGRQISQDTTTSNQPVVAVQPAYNDNFTIQVQMYNCSIAPCYYALALYGRATQ